MWEVRCYWTMTVTVRLRDHKAHMYVHLPTIEMATRIRRQRLEFRIKTLLLQALAKPPDPVRPLRTPINPAYAQALLVEYALLLALVRRIP